MPLYTMPDMKWNVRVKDWSWIYAFSRQGTVAWRDPFNGMSGRGTWHIRDGELITRWAGSRTWEAWQLPLSPNITLGECHMGNETHELVASAIDYYLQPGDVVYTGEAIVRGNGTVASVVYADEVRSGGTVAWLCRNPGNIRDGEKYGAFKGKQLHVNGAGAYAIFPDEATGLKAIVTVLKGYGRVTISQAMHKYAPKKDHNDPDAYAATIARGLKVGVDTLMTSLDEAQMTRVAALVTGVETTQGGQRWARDSAAVPELVRQRLAKPPSPPTEQELRNSSLAQPWW
jgi:hypothetical protein